MGGGGGKLFFPITLLDSLLGVLNWADKKQINKRRAEVFFSMCTAFTHGNTKVSNSKCWLELELV